MTLSLFANAGSTIATLNDEKLQTSLKQSQSSCTKSLASQLSELADIKRRLEENITLAKEAASETKACSSGFDVYVYLGQHLDLVLTRPFRTYLKHFGADILLFMQKIWSVLNT